MPCAAKNIVIEDRVSGTSSYKIGERTECTGRPDARLKWISSRASIRKVAPSKKGFVYIPTQAERLPEYLREVAAIPKGKDDDRVDATAQALDSWKQRMQGFGLLDWAREKYPNPRRVKRSLFVKKHDQTTLTSRV